MCLIGLRPAEWVRNEKRASLLDLAQIRMIIESRVKLEIETPDYALVLRRTQQLEGVLLNHSGYLSNQGDYWRNNGV